jgi:hypothetical protein
VLVVSVVASGALEETDISADASGFVAAARSFAPMRFDATRTGSSSDGTSHLLFVTKREHSRFDSNDCYTSADNNDLCSLVNPLGRYASLGERVCAKLNTMGSRI